MFQLPRLDDDVEMAGARGTRTLMTGGPADVRLTSSPECGVPLVCGRVPACRENRWRGSGGAGRKGKQQAGGGMRHSQPLVVVAISVAWQRISAPLGWGGTGGSCERDERAVSGRERHRFFIL